tara:strand:- start:12602 stop:14308 length:1707 start_codon:yes stop_codon:yes gene_type:complete
MDSSQQQPFIFPLKGGLVLNKSNFEVESGSALELENFEPDTTGGYRRINGYEKWSNHTVPFTTSSTEKVLMSALYNNEVIAARGESIYRATDSATTLDGTITDIVTSIVLTSTVGFTTTGTILIEDELITYTGISTNTLTGCTRGTSSTTPIAHTTGVAVYQGWTSIDSGRTAAEKYNFERLTYNNVDVLLFADGANSASYWNGSAITDINSTGAPADPSVVTVFKNTIFMAGASATPNEIVYAAPLSVDDFTSANGAGSFVIDATVTGMKVFREELYIFSASRIYKLVGSSQADFQLVSVTREIGCRNGSTIQEFAGNLVFLGPDGLRTVEGTARIGDVELSAITKPVQELFQGRTDVADFDSVVIPNKTQYRIFFNSENSTASSTDGVICVRTQEGYEFATTKGLQTSCTDSDEYLGDFYVLHGSNDGYVYRQEKGNTFDGTTIIGRYRSPDLTAGDAGIRKSFQRVIINYAPEGKVNADLFLRYDYESPDAPRPAAYPFDSTKVVALYGTAEYGVSTYGGQTDPLIRQSVEGSGFSVALRVVDNGISVPYSLKGFQLEFKAAARR